ncbi:MAG: MFS transporter [Anaerolineae bacterium]
MRQNLTGTPGGTAADSSSDCPGTTPAIETTRTPNRAAAATGYLGRLFINRNYALFMAGAFVSATGSWAQSVALGWLVLSLGNSEFLLGLTNFAQMVPLLLLAVPAGAIIDRFNHKHLLLFAQTGAMAANGVLAVATLAGVRSIPLILVTAVAGGLCNAVGWPMWSVFINDLVGPENLRSAVAVNSARFNLTRVIGPALAGVLLAAYGAGICLAISALSALGVVGAIIAIKMPPFVPKPVRPWLPAMREGLGYCWRTPSVRELLLITSGIGFLALPYQTFLPAFARDVLGRGPETLGLLLTSVGFGALGGAALSGSRYAARNSRRLMIGLVLVVGVALIALALSRNLHLAMVTLAIVGLSMIGYLAVANATLQLTCRPDLLGRVMGVWTVVNAGMTPVGSLAIGAAAEQVGLTTAMGAAGGLCALLGIGVSLGSLRRRRRARRAPAEAA